MVDGLYSVTLILLTVISAAVIFVALRRRRQRPVLSPHASSLLEGTEVAILASTSKQAQSWARAHGLDDEQYYFIDSIDDLREKSPCFYVPVDGYDQRSDWPQVYAELAARGYVRWWPPLREGGTAP